MMIWAEPLGRQSDLSRGAKQQRHSLKKIKAAFADPTRLNRTMSAAEGAEDLGMDEQAVVDVISGLAASDFEKSMRSNVQ